MALPASQAVHAFERSTFEYFPAGHAVHGAYPSLEEYCPFAQAARHAVFAAFGMLVSPHASHDAAPMDLDTLPAAHTVHVFAPAPEYLPAAHVLHGM